MATKSRAGRGSGNKRPSEELDGDALMHMYRDMVRQRRMEESFARAYGMGKIYGFCHLYIGQEAIPAGCHMAIEPDDLVVSAYRIHGQALSKGIGVQEIADELFGRASGCAGGIGGSMHLYDVEKGFLGGWGLVGQQVPMAVGVAFAQKYRETGKVTLAFLGDGAVNQGAVHEALNMASIWDVPIVIIVENNKYGMGTDIHRVSSLPPIHEMGASYKIEHADFDGMDALATYDALVPAVKRAREESRPTLLEARCSRFRGHSMSDPAKYRSKEELEDEKAQDPIPKMRSYLVEKKHASEDELDEIDKEAKAEMKQVLKKAEEAEWPSEDAIHRNVYADAASQASEG